MKFRFSFFVLMVILVAACQQDPKVRAEEQKKEAKKREVVFKAINEGWNFKAQPYNAVSSSLTGSWSEWRMFLSELGQKPKSSIGAFQQKAKTLAKRANDLNNNIPIMYDLPEVKSRIEVVQTKFNLIDLYIHLGQIPAQKIVQLIKEINIELQSFQQQLNEVVVKKQIKVEDGESDMLRMLDTTRAIPTNPNAQIIK